jgi:Ras-related protein Rab-8A
MGEKGFRELLKDAYFFGAQGVVAVADITRQRTLEDLDDWIDGVFRVVNERIPVMIAVNKVDLLTEAQFPRAKVEQVAEAFGARYFYTSAKTGHNVEKAFQALAETICENHVDGRK